MDPSSDSPIGPVAPVSGAWPVQPVRTDPTVAVPSSGSAGPGVAAVTGGSLPASYAQFEVNPDTHDVVIRIKDALTDQVIDEYPSREIEAMAASMKQYADMLARRRVALHSETRG
jgi:FlaG protein